jgi:hypothetical protein
MVYGPVTSTMIRLFPELVSHPKNAREGGSMAEKVEDLGIPMRPARAAVQAIPARVSDVARSITETPKAAEMTAEHPPRTEPAEPRTMVVGRGISLSGDIKSCNRLVVEGILEAKLHDCRQMEIAETGYFKGTASIEQADVRGQFEGELVVSKRLLIRATGHVSGP